MHRLAVVAVRPLDLPPIALLLVHIGQTVDRTELGQPLCLGEELFNLLRLHQVGRVEAVQRTERRQEAGTHPGHDPAHRHRRHCRTGGALVVEARVRVVRFALLLHVGMRLVRRLILDDGRPDDHEGCAVGRRGERRLRRLIVNDGLGELAEVPLLQLRGGTVVCGDLIDISDSLLVCLVDGNSSTYDSLLLLAFLLLLLLVLLVLPLQGH